MCDVALLCHLVCARFVASNNSVLVLQTAGQLQLRLHFYTTQLKVLLFMINRSTRKKTTISTFNVAVHAKASQIQNTARFARHIIFQVQKWQIPRPIECGIAASITDGTPIDTIMLIIATFCNTTQIHQNTLSNTAMFANNVHISFMATYVLILFNSDKKKNAKLRIQGTGMFLQTQHGMQTASDGAHFNWDAYIADMCHAIFAQQ